MKTVSGDHPVTSPERSFEVDKPEYNAHEAVMAKIDSPLREVGKAIQGMSVLHLTIARGRIRALSIAVDIEEKLRHEETLRAKWEREASQTPTSARAERSAARLKRKRAEHERSAGNGKCDYPICDGVIVLDPDTDGPERLKATGATSKVTMDPGGAKDTSAEDGGTGDAPVEGVEAVAVAVALAEG